MARLKKIKKSWSPNAYIKSHLRKIWRWSPQRRECLKAQVCVNGKRHKGKIFADHIEPVVEIQTGFTTWDRYIERLFTGKLQPLCEDCHSKKTKEENRQRREVKKAKIALGLAILKNV